MPNNPAPALLDVAIIGGGPAGLMAAEQLSARGLRLGLFEANASIGRKFLLAGIGGLNLTHSEALEPFLNRFSPAAPLLLQAVQTWGPAELRAWAQQLGIETFVGSSGRVFPVGMKAAPLLRAWLQRLRAQGVQTWVRHRWQGWTDEGALQFDTPEGRTSLRARAVLLALGGASWPRLGSDGAWQPWLAERGVRLQPFMAANCGFELNWSPYLIEHFAGQPLKSIRLRLAQPDGVLERDGDAILTEAGLEGSLIYALSSAIRHRIQQQGQARIELDLSPNRSLARLEQDLSRPRGSASFGKYLKQRTGLSGVKAALLHEVSSPTQRDDPAALAQLIKAVPLDCLRPRPLAEAISSAGGVDWSAVNADWMLKSLPGVFVAGEMLDWEAPTGGYLLTGCVASGRAAAAGVLNWLERSPAEL